MLISEQNVELVLSLVGVVRDAGADSARLVRDDELWARMVEMAAPYLHED
jgi:hypothetical protein